MEVYPLRAATGIFLANNYSIQKLLEIHMSNKTELIQEMLDMQTKFIAYEQSGEFDAEDYYVGEWKSYRERYQELTNEVRELASKEVDFWK